MDKEVLEKLLLEKYTIKRLATHFDCSQSTIRYWLKKHDLKTFRGPKGKYPKDYQKLRKCACGETDPDKFYGNKSQICAKCHNQYQLDKGREQKKRAVQYLGGKCSECGYNKCDAALDIHHLDSSKKDPNFRTHRYWSWNKLVEELKTCVLLCKNCHAEKHYLNNRGMV